MEEQPPEVVFTKKQKKELRRLEKMNSAETQAKKARWNRILLWFFVLVGVAGVIGGMVTLVSRKSGTSAPVPLANALTPEDWQKGPVEAPLTLIEYSDFQCPACATYYPTLKQLALDFPNELRIAYRHFPLSSIHPNAEDAARVAEAAGMQGKFWEMHDKLFENQTAWSPAKDPRGMFEGYASDIGLDVDRFRIDMTSKAAKDAVQSDYRSGLRDGISSTPTFYLNGTRISGADIRNYEAFRNLIQTTLDQNPS